MYLPSVQSGAAFSLNSDYEGNSSCFQNIDVLQQYPFLYYTNQDNLS